MLQKLFILILFITLSACQKSEEDRGSDHALEFQIVGLLNQGDYKSTLDLIQNYELRNGENVSLNYYKAQALSLRASVNVYSLFPILKMKLFEVAMSEWSDMRRFEDRSRREVTIRTLGDDEPAINLKDLDLQLKELQALPLDKIKFEVTTENYTIASFQWGSTNKSCNIMAQVFSEHFLEQSMSIGVFARRAYSVDLNEDCNHIKYGPTIFSIIQEMSGSLEVAEEVKDNAIVQLKIKKKDIIKRKESERFIKAIFALYDSIPVIKGVPQLTEQSFQDIKRALSILEKIRNDDNAPEHLRHNSIQQIALLSGFLILGSMKNAIELDKVEEPHDIICFTDPTILVNHYESVNTGVRYLMPVIEETEMGNKNRNSIERLKLRLKEIPEKISDEEKQKIIQTINSYKRTNC